MALEVQSPLLFITGSTPSTPSSGFGTIFASGSALFYINDAGTVTNLVQGRTNLLEYTGSATYTTPANITQI